MSKMDYFFKTKFVKMGRWALLPLDSENWHGEETSRYFKKRFGIGKGTLTLHFIDDSLAQNAYFPKSYFDLLYNRITEINRKDYKGLEKIIKPFYQLQKKFKKSVPQITVKDFSKLSNQKLASLYRKNRDWVHQATVFDQFGWIAEEYWTPLMRDILVYKLGIEENSPEYHRVMFILTKPEKISTTLEEKRSVIKESIDVKQKKQTIANAAKKLAKLYGWMPVFTFGTPWDEKHYQAELTEISRINLEKLMQEFSDLKNYSRIRNRELREVTRQYSITPRDLQIFADFALTLDARNEGEYLVSLGGYHVLPMYKEIAKRFAISIKQLRCLYEKEILAGLAGKIEPEKRLQEKDNAIGWGFGRDLLKRVYFTSAETRKLYAHIEKSVTNLHGNNEEQGVCASPGIIKGRVCIIHGPEDNHKIKSGEILITHATTVDYLPAMKKAAAFVTEVGGLTCHAAVVAREFGVPCVVGLKNATRNFKDGDMVEVDANKGIVRRLADK